MIKKLLLLVAVAATTTFTFGQTTIIDFEDVDGFNVAVNNANGITHVEDQTNTATSGINSSATCMQIDELANSQWWHRLNLIDFGTMDLVNGKFITMKFRILSPATKTSGDIRLTLRGSEETVTVPYTGITIGEWFELEFDFSAGADGSNWGIEIITDNNVNNTEALSFQIDDITQHTATTLSVSEFTKGDISNLITSSNPVERTIELRASGVYSIANITGQTILKGDFDRSINVESLKTGLYFLAINEGVYKFVKR